MALQLLAFLAVLVVVSRWVVAPLRAGAGAAPGDAVSVSGEIPTLEAERDARLAAVRDAELDLRTGKLTPAEHAALDADLRTDALEALRALDAARERSLDADRTNLLAPSPANSPDPSTANSLDPSPARDEDES